MNLSNVEKDKAHLIPALVLAYVGDAVYEVYVRTKIINDGFAKTNVLHHKATEYVKARAQAEILDNIYESLTDEEKDVVRRGKNATSHTIPKNADVLDYKKATAFEALIGYLFLSDKKDRLDDIISKIM